MSKGLIKRCRVCGREKPLADFYKDRGAKDGLCSKCKDCAKRDANRWYAEHSEQAILRVRQYHAEHRAQATAQCRVYRETHQEQVKAQQRQAYRDNAEERKAAVREYKNQNPEKASAACKRWKQEHPRRVNEINGVRAAKRRTSGLCDLTIQQWDAIKAAHDYRCAYCGERPDVLTVDHVVPLAKGGNHTASNVVPACSHCNYSKGARPLPVTLGKKYA